MGWGFSGPPCWLTGNSPFRPCLPCQARFPTSLLFSLSPLNKLLTLKSWSQGLLLREHTPVPWFTRFGFMMCLPFGMFDSHLLFRDRSLVWRGVTSSQPLWSLSGRLAVPPGCATSTFGLQVSHYFAAQFMWDFTRADLSLMANPRFSSCHFVPELILS